MSQRLQVDRLPPHSVEAEQGILGCVLLEPACLAQVCERLDGHPEAFYVLSHRTIFTTLAGMRTAGEGIDLITLQNRLKERHRLEEVGGRQFLSGLPDGVPSAANITHYLGILWEKYLARAYVQAATDNVATVMEHDGMPETMHTQVTQRFEAWRALTQSSAGAAPPNIVSPLDFAEECLNIWVKRRSEIYGYEMPITLSKEVRFRPYESTVFTAESGAGKSTFLYHTVVHLVAQGAKVFIASLEEAVPDILWVMTRQAMAATRIHLEETDENIRTIGNALNWLQERVRLYNFLGIGSWREVLRCFRHLAREEKYDVAIFDSLTKGGIADDDYAQQAVAANAFSDHALATGQHSIVVIHQNKAEGKDIKRKTRGAGTLIDVPNLVLGIRRNEKKEQASDALDNEARVQDIILNDPCSLHGARQAAKDKLIEISAKRQDQRMEWDSELRLVKQRYKGAIRQNASRRFYFDVVSQQFKTDFAAPPRCYVNEKPKPKSNP